jgi:serine/threonine protein kinase
VYVERRHLALRGLFIIDPNGVLQYQVVHSLSIGRSSDEVLRVLEGLQIGGLCPGERQLGQPSLDVLEGLGPNRVIGQFQVEESVGSGSFGAVYRARDMLLGRTVALKVLRPGASLASETLLAEARAAAALNHPNVCTIFAVDAADGAPMIVMEYVAGESLASRLRSGALSRQDVATFARQIAAGMAAAHAAGVVHGDLKPGNIMITANDAIKIMDFGLARRIAVPNPHEETMAWTPPRSGLSGTPGYMAPEQIRGEPATPASDVFALGLILYEMLAGQPAVTGSSPLQVLIRMQRFDPSLLVIDAPEPFAGILHEALARDAGERRITMSQIAERLS